MNEERGRHVTEQLPHGSTDSKFWGGGQRQGLTFEKDLEDKKIDLRQKRRKRYYTAGEETCAKA